MSRILPTLPALTLLRTLAMSPSVAAQEKAPDEEASEEAAEEKKNWSNSTDLSLVVTEGNSNAETFGLRNTLVRSWEISRFQLKLNGNRSKTADDRFLQVDPGFTWIPGEDPPPVTTSLVEPSSEPDVEQYFIEGRYDSRITERFTWNAGASWDRNRDAGILSRTIVFGGLGNIWWDRDDLSFTTTYGLSYTDREDETPDPERDERFAGLRFNWQYLNKWGNVTVYKNDWTINANISDPEDFSFDMLNSIAVNMSKHLALQVSLQFLYNNLPALEDLDIVARVTLVDPDGIPGSGDEYYETSADGGIAFDVGVSQERKKRLDTIFNTSLVVSF